ncbi:uncharacterized protein LOC134228107 [Armigeres subalbatus]|uniref:uncharacterized protein LOC134228107 n=1 Tax=Armigeres subalbatus TaxID=124917 RepID=UPI002ED57C8C
MGSAKLAPPAAAAVAKTMNVAITAYATATEVRWAHSASSMFNQEKTTSQILAHTDGADAVLFRLNARRLLRSDIFWCSSARAASQFAARGRALTARTSDKSAGTSHGTSLLTER